MCSRHCNWKVVPKQFHFGSNNWKCCARQFTGSIWILVHFIGQAIPFLFYAYYAVYSLDNFIPIQGRSGPSTNPEILIAIIAGCTGILMVGQLVQTLCIFRRPVIWMCGFLFVFLVFIILMATPLGFPYREALSQQRFWIFVSELQKFYVLNDWRAKMHSAHRTSILQFR